jgi:hypothetical protein
MGGLVLRTVVLSAGVAVAGVALSGTAQQKPNFTGIWAATKDAPANLPMAPSAILGGRFELRHKGTSLTILRGVRDVSFEGTFEIGGPEARTRVRGGLCMPDSILIETAAWEGSALAFTLTGTAAQPGKLNVKRLFHQPDPNTLVVEGTIVQAGKPQQVGSVYKRTTEAMAPVAPPLAANKAAATIADAAWVAGVWASEGASTVEERWTPPAGGTMHAVARTVRGTILGSFEFLCIVEREGGLIYSAMPNGRSPATDFVLTQLTPDSLTFENPQHDFPKVIKYSRKADGSLETAISGAPGSRVITVTLMKK